MGSDQRPARRASCPALTLALLASLGLAMSIATAEERNSTAGAKTAQPVKDGAVLAAPSIDRAKSATKPAAAEVRFLDGSKT